MNINLGLHLILFINFLFLIPVATWSRSNLLLLPQGRFTAEVRENSFMVSRKLYFFNFVQASLSESLIHGPLSLKFTISNRSASVEKSAMELGSGRVGELAYALFYHIFKITFNTMEMPCYLVFF
jgi:hypothetical protein